MDTLMIADRVKVEDGLVDEDNEEWLGIPRQEVSTTNFKHVKISRHNYTICAICDVGFPADTKHVNGDQEAEVLRIVCTHLNVSEFWESLGHSDNPSESTSSTSAPNLEVFHLCPTCNESATQLVSLHRNLEKLLGDIGVLVELLRTAVSNSVGVAQNQTCPRVPRDETGNDSIWQFRALVLQNGSGSSVKVAKPETSQGQEVYESQTDFAFLEAVSSEGSDNVGFPSEDVDVSVEDIKCEDVSAPTSPFSPTSFSHEDKEETEVFPQSSSMETEADGHINLPDFHGEVDTDPQISSNNGKAPKQKIRTHQGVSNRHKKAMVRLPTKTIVQTRKTKPKFSIPAGLPKCETEGFKTMQKLKIPFRRLEVQLKRLSEKRGSNSINDKLPFEGIRRTRNFNYNASNVKRNRRELLKKRPFYGKVRGTRNKPEHIIQNQPEANDPDYNPNMDSASEIEKSEEEVEKPKQFKSKRRRGIRRGTETIDQASKITLTTESDGSKTYSGVMVNEKTDGTFQCSKCQKEYPDVLTLARHIRWEHTDTPKHYYRQPLFPIRRRLLRRQKSDGKVLVGDTEIFVNEMGIHTCGTCGKFFQSQRGLINHVKETHVEPQVLTKKVVESPENSLESSRYSFWARTIYGKDGRMFYGGFEIGEIENGRFQCLTCEKDFKKILGVQFHIRHVHGKQPLPQRKPKPRSLKLLFKITETLDGQKSYGPIPFEDLENGQCQCGSEDCGKKIMKSRDSLYRHIRGVHLKHKTAIQKDDVNSDTRTKMTKCVKTSDGRVYFRGTEMLRTPDGNHQCGTCKKITVGISGLQGHITRHHENSLGPYTCQYCGKSVGYKFLLRNHELTHKNVRDFTCDQCGKTFKHFNSLSHHIRQVHNKESRHQCKICGKGYYVTREFIRHLKTHSAKDRPFTCDVPGCGKSFTSEANIKFHTKTHSYRKSYKCSECESAFWTSVAMNNHMKETHTDEVPHSHSYSTSGSEPLLPPPLTRQDELVTEVQELIDADYAPANANPPQLVLASMQY